MGNDVAVSTDLPASTAERRANALLEVALATSTLELDEVLERVVDLTASLVGADRCSIFLLTHDRSMLVSAAIHGVDPGWAAAWRRHSYNVESERLSHHVLSSLQPLIVEDALTHPLTDKEAVAFFGDRSILVAPLVCRGEALGTLFLNYISAPHVFPDDEIELTMALASQAAVAIHNAQLYERSRETSEALRWSMRQLGSMALSPNLDEILHSITRVAARLIKVPACGIRLPDEATGCLVYRAAVGIPREMFSESTLRLGEGLSGRAMQEGQPVWSADMLTDPRVRDPEFIRRLGVRGYLGVPLFGRGQTIGVLCAYTVGSHHFTAEEIDLLSSFADQAALAVENAGLFDQVKRRADELSQLQRIGNALTSSLDLVPLLEIVAHGAMEITEADYCAIYLVDPDSAEVDRVVAIPEGPGLVKTVRRPLGLTNAVIETGQIEVVGDAAEDPRVHPSLIEEGIRSILGMPLRVGDKIMGVLWANSVRPRNFNRHHVEVLSVLADQVGLVLRNALLYREVQREKDELETVFRNVSDGIAVFDFERTLRDANPAAARLLGASAEHLRGQTCRAALQCDATGVCELGCCLERSVNEAPFHWDATIGLDSTNSIDLEVSAVPVGTAGSTTAIHVVVLHDVTESKRIERAKSDFISMVSHELRTPLSLVKGYASTLLRKELSLDAGMRERFIRNIDLAADRLSRLVNDLLSVTRLEAGAFELRLKRFDLREAIERVVRSDVGMAQNTQLLLPSNPVWIDADRDRIEQVVDNLVRNAQFHSGTNAPIRVTVELLAHDVGSIGPPDGYERYVPYRLPRAGRFVLVSVEDHGRGLDRDTMRRVFDKFYRAEGGVRAPVGGMGLGLYLARGLVEAHRGHIWVESGTGKGASFRFALPIASETVAGGNGS